MEPAVLNSRDAPLVLVVDDNPTDRLLMCETLAQNGFAVETARNGLETLEAVYRHRPDVLLLDVLMPYLDGFNVLTKLRRDPDTQHLPVIVVTGLEDSNSINRSYEDPFPRPALDQCRPGQTGKDHPLRGNRHRHHQTEEGGEADSLPGVP